MQIFLLVVVGLSFAMPASSAILFYEDFEDALKVQEEWRYSGGHGSQGLTTEQIRYGLKSYKFSLTRYDSGDYREELTLLAGFNNGSYNFTIGNEYWIGFSIFLADGYYNNNWAIHHQYHAVPDSPPTCENEPWRNPVVSISTPDGGWKSTSLRDSRQCTPAIGDYEGQAHKNYDGAFSTGQWCDFVINIKWSFGVDGFLKIWKNGVLETDQTGGNCFNDNKGPYLKIGIYGSFDQDQTMTIYYDELRIGDSSSSYSEVVPGGCTLPTVTTQAVADITTTTAIGHGTITNTGGENATKRGFCWNTTGSPTVVDDNITEQGNFSTGAFSGNITGLTPDQHYYVRAFAYNAGGYGYGSVVSFDAAVESGTYVIDDEDNVTSSTGSWHTSGGADPYATGSVYADTDATFSFPKTIDGNYTVSVWWTVAGTNRDENATIEIYDGIAGENLLDTKHVNQKLNGGQWNVQDTYDFNATAKVVIVSTADDPVAATSADAVKFDYVEGSAGESINTLSRMPGMCFQGCGIN